MDVLLVSTVGAFAILCLVAIRRGLAYRHAASIWLALSFASIALAGLLAPQLDGARTPARCDGAWAWWRCCCSPA